MDINENLQPKVIKPADINPSSYKDTYKIPTKFQEAWHHPDPYQREKWRTATRTEFNKMRTMVVWRKVKRSTMPKERRCVKNRWVFDIKRNGIFWAKLVALLSGCYQW